MGRQLAITKKTYLDEFEGWDKECYVEWRPMTYGDGIRFKKLEVDENDEAKAYETIFNLTKEHIVGGKVRVLGDDGKPELADYQPEDLDQMPPDMINKIFSDMTGAKFGDPKGLTEAQEKLPSPQKQESTTETS